MMMDESTLERLTDSTTYSTACLFFSPFVRDRQVPTICAKICIFGVTGQRGELAR